MKRRNFLTTLAAASASLVSGAQAVGAGDLMEIPHIQVITKEDVFRYVVTYRFPDGVKATSEGWGAFEPISDMEERLFDYYFHQMIEFALLQCRQVGVPTNHYDLECGGLGERVPQRIRKIHV